MCIPSCSNDTHPVIQHDSVYNEVPLPLVNKTSSVEKNEPSNSSESNFSTLDIGLYLNTHIDDELRIKLLKEAWNPGETYDFKKDVPEGKRSFLFKWIKLYPWLTYSAAAKGPFCRFCFLFTTPSIVNRGRSDGRFVHQPCTTYTKFIDVAKKHVEQEWHIAAMRAANDFEKSMENKKLSVQQLADANYRKIIEENRMKLKPIISSLLFCALHDLPIRGHAEEGSVFRDLLEFRLDAGDEILKNHLEFSAKKALYISHRSQNELVASCSDVLKAEIIQEVKEASFYSVLADETADISGTEQLSIGVRYLRQDADEQKYVICEEFLGYIPLQKLDAKTISANILQFLSDSGLNLDQLVGQGYDGCSTMAGHVGGVQKLIRDQYPRAMYFHCASHILNLVINDQNNLPEIRNAAGTTKEVIQFFRESTLRRHMIPNIPLFCETRWSSKYRSIRIFFENFEAIVKALEELSKGGNSTTRTKAYQLHTTVTTPGYLVALAVMATYSSMLEPVCQELQSVNMNIMSVNEHIENLVIVLASHRENASEEFRLIFTKVQEFCEKLGVEMRRPRVTGRLTGRSNQPAENDEEYFRRSIFIPYLDSIISSLSHRFGEAHSTAFSVMLLHPKFLKKMEKSKFLDVINNINSVYGVFFCRISKVKQKLGMIYGLLKIYLRRTLSTSI